MDGQTSEIQGKTTLYRGLITAFVPDPPRIPQKEGLDIQISGQHDAQDNPKQILNRFLIGLGTAKAITESIHTRDCWANTRITRDKQVHAFGRVPQEESSWRKPVDTNGNQKQDFEDLNKFYDKNKLIKLFGRYLPKWEQLATNIKLFEDGIKGQDIKYSQENREVIWTNGKFEVQLFRSGHLTGYHFMISPIGKLKENFERQWQTINESSKVIEDQEMVQKYLQATLEATAIGLGIQQLVAPDQGEIHNSGNWAKGLKILEEGGTLDLNLAKKDFKTEKKRHFTRIKINDQDQIITEKPEASFGTSMHVHLYIPTNQEKVILPEMSRAEAEEKNKQNIVKQWDQIQPLTDEQISQLTTKLHNNRLNSYMEKNCLGPLI